MRRFLALPCKLLIVASAGFAQFAAADTEHTTPRASEISPSEWRSQQLRAADKSDKIMHDARKLPGLLAQYVYMQGQYDANHERAFQIIFGQFKPGGCLVLHFITSICSIERQPRPQS